MATLSRPRRVLVAFSASIIAPGRFQPFAVSPSSAFAGRVADGPEPVLRFVVHPFNNRTHQRQRLFLSVAAFGHSPTRARRKTHLVVLVIPEIPVAGEGPRSRRQSQPSWESVVFHLGWLAPLPLDAVADRVRAGNERGVAVAPNFEQERAIEWFVEAVSKVDGRSAISHHREPTHVDTGHLQLGRRH